MNTKNFTRKWSGRITEILESLSRKLKADGFRVSKVKTFVSGEIMWVLVVKKTQAYPYDVDIAIGFYPNRNPAGLFSPNFSVFVKREFEMLLDVPLADEPIDLNDNTAVEEAIRVAENASLHLDKIKESMNYPLIGMPGFPTPIEEGDEWLKSSVEVFRNLIGLTTGGAFLLQRTKKAEEKYALRSSPVGWRPTQGQYIEIMKSVEDLWAKRGHVFTPEKFAILSELMVGPKSLADLLDSIASENPFTYGQLKEAFADIESKDGGRETLITYDPAEFANISGH